MSGLSGTSLITGNNSAMSVKMGVVDGKNLMSTGASKLSSLSSSYDIDDSFTSSGSSGSGIPIYGDITTETAGAKIAGTALLSAAELGTSYALGKGFESGYMSLESYPGPGTDRLASFLGLGACVGMAIYDGMKAMSHFGRSYLEAEYKQKPILTNPEFVKGVLSSVSSVAKLGLLIPAGSVAFPVIAVSTAISAALDIFDIIKDKR